MNAHGLGQGEEFRRARRQDLPGRGVKKQRRPEAMAELLEETRPREQAKDSFAVDDDHAGEQRVALESGMDDARRLTGGHAKVILLHAGERQAGRSFS